MSWIVTVHSTGGSVGEAVDSMFTVRVVNQEAAKIIADQLNEMIRVGGYDEVFATYTEIKVDLIDAPYGGSITSRLATILADRFD